MGKDLICIDFLSQEGRVFLVGEALPSLEGELGKESVVASETGLDCEHLLHLLFFLVDNKLLIPALIA